MWYDGDTEKASTNLVIRKKRGSKQMNIKKEDFGVTKNQEKVEKYTLQNQNGVSVSLINYGAIVTNILVPDRDGLLEDVVMGFDTLEGYEENHPMFGAIVGRVANRIANASFSLNGKIYTLDRNDGRNYLHGGNFHFEHCMYQAECSDNGKSGSVTFTRESKDMEQGFPGNATIAVTYTLNNANELMIAYYAVSDQDTVMNLTNHSYFNIGKEGHKGRDVLGHTLQVFADAYTPSDAQLLPTGEIRPVDNTALDFRMPHKIGERIGEAAQDEKTVAGYDHNYVLRKETGGIEKAASYWDQGSGRRMEVFTDFPGMQLYTANQLEKVDGKDGADYGQFGAVCFETQNYPDAINHPEFPDAVLRAGEEYERTAVFKFDII